MTCPIINSLDELLGSSFRVTLKDQRIFLGVLVCIDRFANLVLKQVTERVIVDGDKQPEEHLHPHILLTRQYIHKIELEHSTSQDDLF